MQTFFDKAIGWQLACKKNRSFSVSNVKIINETNYTIGNSIKNIIWSLIKCRNINSGINFPSFQVFLILDISLRCISKYEMRIFCSRRRQKPWHYLKPFEHCQQPWHYLKPFEHCQQDFLLLDLQQTAILNLYLIVAIIRPKLRFL